MKMFIMPAIAMAIAAFAVSPTALDASQLVQITGGEDPACNSPGTRDTRCPSSEGQECPGLALKYKSCRPKRIVVSENTGLCQDDAAATSPCSGNSFCVEKFDAIHTTEDSDGKPVCRKLAATALGPIAAGPVSP